MQATVYPVTFHMKQKPVAFYVLWCLETKH